MERLSVFDSEDYKDFLHKTVFRKKGERAYQSRLAESAGCQKSFLSQVLNSHVHLMPDHAAAMADFLGFSQEEQTYFVDLVLLARASAPSLKEVIQKRMKAARDSKANPTEQFRWPEVAPENSDLYYSSWHFGAIHILVSIPRFRSALAVADRLRLPLKTVESSLFALKKMGLVSSYGDEWVTTENFLHLKNTSPMIGSHHFNWRQRAVNNLQLMDETSLHYSSVFALSREDFQLLKQLVVAFTGDTNKKISPSPPEEVAAFTCDLFKI